MATKTPVRPALSDTQLAEVMSLLRGSDTVELKLTVPDSEQRAAIRGLGLDPLDAQIRQVVFFDTPDLALDRAGVVVRARRIQGRVGDSVISSGRSAR
jgi:inorganic triphosphatase YgiF